MPETLTKAGRYEIVGELGRGSMGVVYKGHDPVIGRTVAIKILLPDGLAPAEFQEYKTRFQREAQAAGTLAHPNIITVYDFGEDGGILYLAMECLEGKSLETLVQEQNVLPFESILPIYEQACSALDYAHSHHVVHRDIKPANIMVLRSGLIKITDFGIAKTTSLAMTQAGQILGTPNYMSPEQVKGRSVDGRADIFSLGVILYELVTGEKPFGGQNVTTVIYKIINENPIPPRELDASIPPGMNYIIGKALAKNPDQRYQTCQELVEDLRKYKDLGDATPPGSTVVMTAPPIIADPADVVKTGTAPVADPAEIAKTVNAQTPNASPGPMRVDEVPLERPVRPLVILTPPRPRKKAPQMVWVLAALAIVAIAGVVGVTYLRQSQRPVTTTAAPVYGQLRVDANIEGARFSVDGRTSPNWVTPYTVPELATGTHDVVISKEGYENFQQTVTVESGQTAAVAGNLNLTHAQLETPAQAPLEPAPLISAPMKAVEPANPPPAATAPAQPVTPKAAETAVPHKAAPMSAPPPMHAAPPKPGSIQVTANVDGAKVSLDGHSDPSWTTPFTISDLAPRTYNVVVSKDGYDPYAQDVTVASGAVKALAANLSQPVGEINLRSTPSGLEVSIDGKSYGPTPIRATLPVGKHNVTLNRPGGDPYQTSFQLQSGSILTKTYVVGGSAEVGAVAVRTIPPGATVLADGQPVGGPTPTLFQLPVGHHTLTVQLTGYVPTRKEVEVMASGTPPIDVPLTQK